MNAKRINSSKYFCAVFIYHRYRQTNDSLQRVVPYWAEGRDDTKVPAK